MSDKFEADHFTFIEWGPKVGLAIVASCGFVAVIAFVINLAR